MGGLQTIRAGFGVLAVAMALAAGAPAHGQGARSELPMDRVYSGPVRLPDFAGRDRGYANFRTRIREAMSAGPDFAGHYAIVEIGCGTGCRSIYMGDVATGKVHDFPYGGEKHYLMQLYHSVKDNRVLVLWVENDTCKRDVLTWNGASFSAAGPEALGPMELCGKL